MVKFLRSSTTPLKAVPPEKTRREGWAAEEEEEERQRLGLGFGEGKDDMEGDLVEGNWRARNREEEGPNQLPAIFPRVFALPGSIFFFWKNRIFSPFYFILFSGSFLFFKII